jgi:alpha-1,2-mannosyltransferase
MRSARIAPAAIFLTTLLAIQIAALPIALKLVARTSLYDTTLGAVREFVRGEQRLDSWRPMTRAVSYLMNDHEGTVYDQLFFEGVTKFQYPLSSLWFVIGLSYPRLSALSWIAVCLAALVTTIIAVGNNGARRDSRISSAVLTVTVLLLALAFYPLVKAYTLGQIQTYVNAMAAIAVWAWVSGRKDLAGGVIGLMCLIKPVWVLLIGWAAARREWGTVRTSLALIAVGAAWTTWRFGLSEQLAYVRVLGFLSRHGESYYANQSFNGLANRALFNGPNLEWSRTSFPAFHPAVYATTLTAFAALTIVALVVPPRRRAAGSALDLGAAIVTITITSPIAWEHHFGVLPPIYAVIVALAREGMRLRLAISIAVSYLLCGNYFDATKSFAATRANFVQSYVLAGGLILLWQLYLLMGESGRRSKSGAGRVFRPARAPSQSPAPADNNIA